MPRSPYIVGRAYDWAFFLGAPVLSLVLGIVVSNTWLATDERILATESDTMVGFFIAIVIHAHLVAVVFRSHNNREIRKQFPVRFLVVPVILWIAIVSSAWIAVAATVVATFWDAWHSGAQTFGFVRIYERNHGTPPELGRRLDFWLNQVLYLGPILGGAMLMHHVNSFGEFKDVGAAMLSSIPAQVEGCRRWITWGVIAIGTGFLVVYVLYFWHLARRGHRPSWLKVWLLASTGAVSIYTWGFNSWGQAFLIMNLFHGVQYLALVWAVEGKRIATTLRIPQRPRIALLVFLASVLGYGLGVAALDPDLTTLWAVTLVVSLMHFWYDAFVWSVRRAQV